MIKLENGSYIIGFDDGYQLGKTSNFVFDNGVHRLGSVGPTLKENSQTSAALTEKEGKNWRKAGNT